MRFLKHLIWLFILSLIISSCASGSAISKKEQEPTAKPLPKWETKKCYQNESPSEQKECEHDALDAAAANSFDVAFLRITQLMARISFSTKKNVNRFYRAKNLADEYLEHLNDEFGKSLERACTSGRREDSRSALDECFKFAVFQEKHGNYKKAISFFEDSCHKGWASCGHAAFLILQYEPTNSRDAYFLANIGCEAKYDYVLCLLDAYALEAGIFADDGAKYLKTCSAYKRACESAYITEACPKFRLYAPGGDCFKANKKRSSGGIFKKVTRYCLENPFICVASAVGGALLIEELTHHHKSSGIESPKVTSRQYSINKNQPSEFALAGGTNSAVDKDILKQLKEKISSGTGEFSIGISEKLYSDLLGKWWVGDGYSTAESGEIWISANKLRQYRRPAYKTRRGIVQANFESRDRQTGNFANNGHLTILQQHGSAGGKCLSSRKCSEGLLCYQNLCITERTLHFLSQ